MRKLYSILIAASLAVQIPATAQDSQDPVVLEKEGPTAPAAPIPPSPPAAPTPPTPPVPPAQPAKPDRSPAWRAQVLAWNDPRTVEEGTTEGPISEIRHSVLVLGTVNGDVSTVSGDIAVLGEVHGNVSAISGTVTILGKVTGNVSAVSGNLRIAGKVTGNTSVVGGKMEKAPGGEVSGNSTSVGNGNFSRQSHWNSSKGSFNWSVNPGPGEFIRDFWFSPFMLTWRGGLLTLWIALGCAVAALFQPAILRARAELRQAPARCAALGFLWAILFWMLLGGCLVLSLMLIGIPLVIILVAFDLALGAFGKTLVFAEAGEWVARRLDRPNISIYAAVFIGACALGLVRMVPLIGSLIWFVASLFGVGATLATRFGASSSSAPPQIPQAPASVPA